MALSLDLATSQFGAPFKGAYFRIVLEATSRTRDPLNRFSTMIDVAGYMVKPSDEDTKDIDFRRYHAPYTEVTAMAGAEWLDKCYAWVSAQPDMNGALAI